ncbi:MAG: c-type cytochrome [Vulcanimicrobiaceae bacterium]
MRTFLYGIVFTVAALVAAALAGILGGVLPAGADVKPSPLERWAAKVSLRVTIARESKGYADPLQPTDANLIAGIRLYGQNCAVCHGTSDAKASLLARGLSIKAPLLAKDGVEDDPEGETFWKLEHGIRFSAMPSFAKTLSSDDRWRLTLFLRHMDHLSPAAQAQWKALPSAAATPAA